MRDLGVLINNELKWNLQCSKVTKTAQMKANCIFRSFTTRSSDFLIRMLKTFIFSRHDYASPVFSPILLGDVDLLETILRKFTRRIPEVAVQNLSYQDRLKFLNLDSLELRRLKTDLVWTYKILNGHFDVNLEEFFVLDAETRTRTNGKKLRKPECSTKVREQCFTVRVIRVWNALSEETVQAPSVNVFKNRLDKETNTLKRFCVRAIH